MIDCDTKEEQEIGITEDQISQKNIMNYPNGKVFFPRMISKKTKKLEIMLTLMILNQLRKICIRYRMKKLNIY